MSKPSIQLTKKRSGSDAWKRGYIRLITEPAEPWTDLTPEHVEELWLMKELIDHGYMSGSVTLGTFGTPVSSTIIGPTPAGRIFAEELQKDLDRNSWKGRIKAWGIAFLGWLIGLLTPLIIKHLGG